MAVLFAGFGRDVPPPGYALPELAEFQPAGRYQAPDQDSSLRLETAGEGGCVRTVSLSESPSSDDLVAATIGWLEGGLRPGDTAREVLAAYRRGGAAGLGELRGEYAFALWDRHARSLIVGCDAVGFLAPAYRWDGTTFLLSSRALALLRIAGSQPAWDRRYLTHAFGGVWAQPAGATAFAGIRRMVGGDLFRVSAAGLERLRGDRLAFDCGAPDDPEEAARELGRRVDQWTSARAELGGACVALSGGLDSCVVASALSRGGSGLDAFSLVAPDGRPGDSLSLAGVAASLPGVRHHRVEVTGGSFWPTQATLFDDPVCAGPVLQAGRLALLRAARDRGLTCVFDGDGGDELFDLAWWPRDLIGRIPPRHLVPELRRAEARSLFLRDLAFSGSLGPLSAIWLRRVRRRLRASRPWLRDPFWKAPSFVEAWREARVYQRLRSARQRLPEILASHGRHRRAQDLTRLSVGVAGGSPLLGRAVVDFVGSLRAEVAMDLRQRKALLRRLAAQRVPRAIAFRAKAEPFSSWLVQRCIARDEVVARAVDLVRRTPTLAEHVDPTAVLAAVDAARRARSPGATAFALVELFALVEWLSAVELEYGLSA